MNKILSFLHEKIKRIKPSLKIYLTDYFIVTIGFFSGAFLKFYIFLKYVKTIDTNLIDPRIINTFPLKIVKFYDLGLIMCIIMCVIIFVVRKKNLEKAG